MWGFFWERRGLVFVFAYFCRGSNMKNQTHVNLGTECCTCAYSVWQRNERQVALYISWRYNCKCDLPLSLVPVWLCGYCFQTLKQLLHLSITFVPSMFQTPKLWCSSPCSPTPPTYHIYTVYCSETPKSKCPNPHPLYPHASLLGNSSITVFQLTTPTSYPHVTAQL